MRHIPILILCLFLVGCASTAKDEFSQRGFKEVMVPENPIIFVPGLGYTGKFWEKSQTVKSLNRLEWVYGGELRVKEKNGKIWVEPKKIKRGLFYTVTFSSSQLAITQQGKELAEAVKRVKEANQDTKVILIGHSMGGLASREYLQSDYYANDVAGFISVGTPHRGSNFDLKKPELKLVPKFIRNLKWKVDDKGDAVRDLRQDSIYLNGGNETNSPDDYRSKDVNVNGKIDDNIYGLNSFQDKPLPKDVYYAAIIGSGCPYIATRTQCKISDGIVKVNSQDLNKVPGVNVESTILTTEKDHFGEADDSWVIIEALRPLECTQEQLRTMPKMSQG